jgi:hypothetical protein
LIEERSKVRPPPVRRKTASAIRAAWLNVGPQWRRLIRQTNPPSNHNACTVIFHREKQMHKLKLESLSVETFEVSQSDDAARGTVRAHDGPVYTCDCYQQTCGGLSCPVACRTRYQNTSYTDC